MRVTKKEYNGICEVIDNVKLDERNDDTDVYAAAILSKLGLDGPALSEYGSIAVKD